MMRHIFRIFALAAVLALGAACSDNDTPDAGMGQDALASGMDARPSADAMTPMDGGVPDAAPGGRLERPPILPRAPAGGLPADLRPPR